MSFPLSQLSLCFAYNFEVENTHNYFIGNLEILVHKNQYGILDVWAKYNIDRYVSRASNYAECWKRIVLAV